jgi:hypothetical protein
MIKLLLVDDQPLIRQGLRMRLPLEPDITEVPARKETHHVDRHDDVAIRDESDPEIWFSVLQRKLLQPDHFVSTQDLEQAITDFLTYYNQKAQSINWTYTIEQLEHKLGIDLMSTDGREMFQVHAEFCDQNQE